MTVVPSPVPAANEDDRAHNWHYPFRFLLEVTNAVNLREDNSVSIEEVEDVLLELQRRGHLAVSRPERSVP